MPNFASNYTPRIKIEYVVDDVPHNTIIRFQRDASVDIVAMQALTEAWRAAMEDVLEMTNFQGATNQAKADIVSASYSDQDEDLFIPFAPSVLPITAGDDSGGDPTPLSRATLTSITGLSTEGKKVVLYLWGARAQAGTTSPFADWRLGPSELTDIPTVWSSHFDPTTVGSLAELMGAPDGQPVSFFRQRLNVRVSAKAINAARS